MHRVVFCGTSRAYIVLGDPEARKFTTWDEAIDSIGGPRGDDSTNLAELCAAEALDYEIEENLVAALRSNIEELETLEKSESAC
jgi:hypothetical protein